MARAKMAFDAEPLPVSELLGDDLRRGLRLQTQRMPAEINLRLAVFTRR